MTPFSVTCYLQSFRITKKPYCAMCRNLGYLSLLSRPGLSVPLTYLNRMIVSFSHRFQAFMKLIVNYKINITHFLLVWLGFLQRAM